MDEVGLKREMRASIQQGNVARVSELIGRNPALLQMDTAFGSWLHVAASAGRLEAVKYLVSLGADVNLRSGVFDAAPIKEAASEGHVEVVQYLLTHGAVLDVSEPERNPLFAAIYDGHLEIAKILVENGIDIRVRYTGNSMKDMDAVAYARERGRVEIAEYLETLQ